MDAPALEPKLARALIRPVFLRSLIAALFAVLAVFIFSLDHSYLRYGAAAMLVLTASQIYDHVKTSDSLAPEAARPAQLPRLLAAVALLLGGVGTLFATSTAFAAVVIGATLVLAGAAELAAWVRARKVFEPARDWLITGLAQAGTGAALLVANHLNVHGVLGVLAGGMLIIAIFGFITAVGYRLDGKQAATDPEEGPAPSSTV